MRNLKLLSLLLLCFIIFAGWLNGTQENVKKYKSRFALVVGANDGGPNRVKLRYAFSDANEIKKVLEEMGGVTRDKCTILDQPTKEKFLAEMARMQKHIQKDISENKKVEAIFYYSGHSDENHIFLGEERIAYKELRDIIRRSNADVHIAILDSCASGAFTRLKGGKKVSPLMIDKAYDMKGYAFMTSSSADESSQESDSIQGSFFTHYLVSGLRGAADMSGDGRVTLNEAYHFAFNQTLSQTEKTMSGPQHPNYNIQMSGTGDVLMTEIRKSKSVLIISKKIYGKVFIHNQDNVLVVEFTKPLGRTIELGLDKGQYRIVNIREGQIFEANIVLDEGSIFNLKSEEFVESEKIVTRVRGEIPEESETEKPKQYTRRPFDFSFLALPGFKTSTIVSFSLHILSSRCSILRGLSIGAGVGIVDEDVHGVQIAGIGNHVGKDMKYLQMAGIFNSTLGNVIGFQAAGLFNFIRRDLFGVQTAGLFNSIIRDVEGVQAAGLANFARSIVGLQSSGLINFASHEVKGVQATGIVNFARILTGVQIGTVNVARYTQGVQIGVINFSGQVDGSQIGVINIAKDVKYLSFGLFNIILKGKTDINLWVDELGFVNFGIKHGTDRFYNLYTIGMNLNFDQGCWGLGYGVNIISQKQLFLSIDALAKAIYPEKRMFTNDLGLLASLRFMAGYKLFKNVSIVGGLSFNYFNNFDDEQIDIPEPFHGLTFRWDELDDRFWPRYIYWTGNPDHEW